MHDPTVCCVLLTRDRPEMAARAVRCFRRQSYENKWLLIFYQVEEDLGYPEQNIAEIYMPDAYGKSIGRLRNLANSFTDKTLGIEADIIAHWDSDDYSHHNRIAEQVELLQSSGADVVGYNEMLFWDTRPGQFCGAWMYRNTNTHRPLGTSLCYWRHAWESKLFEDVSSGEDTRWLQGLAVKSQSSLVVKGLPGIPASVPPIVYASDLGVSVARMICTIHGSNTSSSYEVGKMDPYEWRRVPAWDDAVRRTMEEA